MRAPWRRDEGSFDQFYHDRLAHHVGDLVASGADVNEALQVATETIGETLAASSVRLAEVLMRRSPRMLRERRRLHRRFCRRLRKHWGRALDLLFMIIVCCEEAGAEFSSVRMAKRGDYERRLLHEALSGLHARACRTALEVHHLLSGGLAMGALARCRTLHELAVTAMVLRTYGVIEEHSDLAERFLLHHEMLNWSDAQTYQEHWETLGHQPFSAEQLVGFSERRDALVERFGPSYKYTYGWASGIQGVANLKFSDLERLAEVSHLRGYYRWASHEVHADAKGSALNVVEWGGQTCKQSGYANIGLADPGQMAAISLHQVTMSLLLSDDPISPQDLLVLGAMQQLVEEACEEMVGGHRSVQDAEERHQAGKNPCSRPWRRR